MPEAKTQPTGSSVEAYLASRASEAQWPDGQALMALLRRVTHWTPTMWGPSIVGDGSYRYRYDSGRTGESCLTGFAVRGRELVVCLVSESPGQAALLAGLGQHKMGRACLGIRRLADVDLKVPEALVSASVAETLRRYPPESHAESG